jgi:hypothetical protein
MWGNELAICGYLLIMILILVIVIVITFYLMMSTGFLLFWLVLGLITMAAVLWIAIMDTPNYGYSALEKISIWIVFIIILAVLLIILFAAWFMRQLGLPVCGSVYSHKPFCKEIKQMMREQRRRSKW